MVILAEYHLSLVSSIPSSHFSTLSVILWLLELYNLSFGDFCLFTHFLCFALWFGNDKGWHKFLWGRWQFQIISQLISPEFHQEYLITNKVNYTFLQKDWQYKQFEVDIILITTSLKRSQVSQTPGCCDRRLIVFLHGILECLNLDGNPGFHPTSTWSQIEE